MVEHKLLLQRVIQKYCQNNNLTLETTQDGWANFLAKGEKCVQVFGFDLGLNSSASVSIARDKALTNEVLKMGGVPSIPHWSFPENISGRNVRANIDWKQVQELHTENCEGLSVVKPNTGSSGSSVTVHRDFKWLRICANSVLENNNKFTISPYCEFEKETRFVVLDGRPIFAYEKTRPTVNADGQRSISKLIRDAGVKETSCDFSLRPGPISVREYLDSIPAAGHAIYLNWKHNLENGSQAKIVDHTRKPHHVEIALRASSVIGLKLAIVDLAETPGGISVLEVNHGLKMENLFKQDIIDFQFAYQTYKTLLDLRFKNEIDCDTFSDGINKNT